MSFPRWILFPTLILSLAASALAAEPADLPVIRVGMPQDLRPLSFHDPEHGLTGFTPELLRAAEKLGKFRVEMVCDWWKHNTAAFKAGRLDAMAYFSGADSDRHSYYFSATAAKLNDVAYTHVSNPPVTSTSQFKGKRIGVIAGTISHTMAERNPAWQATVIAFYGLDELLAATASGDCDIALLNTAASSAIQAKLNLQKSIVPEIEHELYFALHRGDLKNLLLINEALAELKRNGTYDRLHGKWIAPIQAHPLRWVDLRPYAPATVVVVIVIAGLITWLSSLNRNLRRRATVLQESEERYRALFRNNALSMWLFEPATLRIVAVNAAAIRSFGYDREEFLGMALSSLCTDDERDLFRRQQPVTDTETVGFKEWVFHRKDGTTCPVELLTQAITYEGKNLRQAIAIDVSEKRRWQDRALRAQRLEALGTLASGIAHDLNNMLAPIMFAAPLLRANLRQPELIRHVNTIEQSADRGAALVRQILGFSHGGANSRSLVQLKHVVREVITVVSATLPKHIKIAYNINPEAWPVNANPTQIHQVILNLCINARDAMPNGGRLSLAVTNREVAAPDPTVPGLGPGRWLQITVADDGVGIPPEVLPRIWESFFTTKSGGKGSGLGLPIVRSVVSDHGGVVSVQSAVGHGSTFSVWLPADHTASAGAAEEHTTQVVAAGHQEAILIVEDNPAMREVMVDVIKSAGYHAISCADGIEAIAQYNAHRAAVALVISDLDMPNMNGLVLFSTLKQLDPRLPLVLLSGAAGLGQDNDAFNEARELADATATKPISPEKLLAIVARLLRVPAGAESGAHA